MPETLTTTRPAAHAGPANATRRAAAIENAVMHRADPAAVPLTSDGRDFRGMSLLELARDCLEADGIRTAGLARAQLADRVFEVSAERAAAGLQSTADFPTLLANVAGKSLRAAYEAAPQTFRPIVRETTIADFKPVTRAQLGEAPALEEVREGGEYRRGAMTDAGETYKVATFGKIIGITRQTLVNDDLDAFSRLPRAMGVQAAALESDVVWAQIMANPTMADGQRLFSEAHGNSVIPANVTIDNLGAGRAALALQTGLDGRTPLNLTATYWIGPTSLQYYIERIAGPLRPAKFDDIVPDAIKRLVPIIEPRFDTGIARYGIPANPSSWYVSASPAQIDLVELAYLEGRRGVFTETRVGFEFDGIEVKCRLDVGAKAIDHRGLWRCGLDT